MLFILLALGATGALAGLTGCTTGQSPDSGAADTGLTLDTSPRPDTGLAPCTADPDCDDGIACTVDQCAVGNVCRHTSFDEMCAEDEVCSTSRGCIDGCSNDADCDDGLFCNGAETCIVNVGCFDSDPPDCNDGNSCTTDRCDPAADGCRYDDMCDSGVIPDAGTTCDAFDPAMHLDGTFRLLPAQSSACGAFSFNITTVSLSTAGSTLTVNAGGKVLTTTPIPVGAAFVVSGTDGACGSFEIDGTFECADRFTGTWRATPTGSCASMCSAQNTMVVGVRQ